VIIDESRQSAAVAALRKAIPSLAAVYQFGSSVTGVEHRESDVDLAFLATAPPPMSTASIFSRSWRQY
jgi:predicted nucleotidyltransferase